MFSIILLVVIFFLSYKAAPRERQEEAHVHGAGQVGLLAALALFGVDYFTSFFYATGELMSSLHPYGLQKYGYIAVAVIALANFIFGALYMYSLGVFNEGGGSFTASMRYLGPSLSLIVAVVLIQDYIFTIVVSTLSGVDQLLSLRDAAGIPWFWHFLIGAALAGDYLVPHHPRPRRIRPDRLHTVGHLCLANHRDGCRPVHCAFQRCSRLPISIRSRTPLPWQSHVPDALRLDERAGSLERVGSHVERHPVRDQR